MHPILVIFIIVVVIVALCFINDTEGDGERKLLTGTYDADDTIKDGLRKLIKTYDGVWECQEFKKGTKGGIWYPMVFDIAKHAIPIYPGKDLQSPIWDVQAHKFKEKEKKTLRYLARFKYETVEYRGYTINRLPHLIGHSGDRKVCTPGWCSDKILERNLVGGQTLVFSEDNVEILKRRIDRIIQHEYNKKNNVVVKKELI
jgi:hypothetical protein